MIFHYIYRVNAFFESRPSARISLNSNGTGRHRKPAIITPFGLFGLLKMLFGLKNAANTFQRFMDEVTRGLDFVFAYIDDVLIASTS